MGVAVLKHCRCIAVCGVITLAIVFHHDAGPAAEDVIRLKLNTKETAPGRKVSLFIDIPSDDVQGVPDIPVIEGLRTRFITKRTGFVSDNGDVCTRLIYDLTPTREGKFLIGPLSIKVNNRMARTDDIELLSSGDIERGGSRDIGKNIDQEVDLGGHIWLELDIPKKEFFLNQVVKVNVLLFTDWLDVENITVSDSAPGGYIGTNYEQTGSEIIGEQGERTAILKFSKDIFVPFPGDIVFGPVQATMLISKPKGELLNDNGTFYDRYIGRAGSRETVQQSGTVKLKILPFPEDGKPEGFGGAVGSFSAVAEVDKDVLDAGDTITLTVRIEGKGNMASVRLPEKAETVGVKAFPAKRTSESGETVTFNEVFKIEDASLTELRVMPFSYFDPDTEKYHSVPLGPFHIKVKGSKVANPEQEKVGEKDVLAAMVDIERSPGKSGTHDIYFFGMGRVMVPMVFPLVLFGILSAGESWQRKLREDSPFSRAYHASRKARTMMREAERYLKSGNSVLYYDTIYRALQGYLGIRYGVPVETVTEELIEHKIIPGDEGGKVSQDIKTVFFECYLARYTRYTHNKKNMADIFRLVERIISYLNGFGEL